MRHLTLLLCLAGLCCHLCLTAQQPVKVNGIVKGIGSGRLLMIVPVNETQTDTIATTDFKESSEFTLEGMVKEPTGVQIMLENYSGGFFFFAEPGHTYEASLSNGNDSYIRGEGLQADWLRYLNDIQTISTRRDSLQQIFEQLKAQSKFRSASAANDRLEAYQKESGEQIRQFLASRDDVLKAYIVYTFTCQNELERLAAWSNMQI